MKDAIILHDILSQYIITPGTAVLVGVARLEAIGGALCTLLWKRPRVGGRWGPSSRQPRVSLAPAQ